MNPPNEFWQVTVIAKETGLMSIFQTSNREELKTFCEGMKKADKYVYIVHTCKRTGETL